MSQSSTGAPQANSVKVSYTHASKDCAIIDNDPSKPIIINGISALEGEQLCSARFIVRRSSNFDSFIGIQLGFLLSTDLNEQSGFGICQHVDMNQKSGVVVPTNRHVIVIKFPRGHFTYTVQPSLPEVLACFPGSTASKFCQISVQFTDNAQATIHGYGVPFTNVSNTTVEGWINRHESFINGMTLPEFLHQTRFSFTVATAVNDVQAMMDINKLPPPFEYPYGTDHEWHRERYEEQSRNLKGEKAYISSRFAAENKHSDRSSDGLARGGPEDAPTRQQKVVGLKAFEPMAESTNAVVSGSKEETADKMSLHRAVMRGTGFWDWMRGIDPATNITSGLAAMPLKRQPLPKLRELPVVNFLDIGDVDYVNALLHEALPKDRVRFKGYLSHRPLGLGMMTAGPGFGKTTAIATATLCMQAKLYRIFCSGPTNVAVDNFADRLDQTTSSVCKRYNTGKQQEDPTRMRHRLVVRAFRMQDEFAAVMHLLRYPISESDGPRIPIAKTSRWRFNLSISSWLLAVLGSRAVGVRELTPDDSEGLFILRACIEERPQYSNLLAVAKGEIGWDEYVLSGVLQKDAVHALLKAIIEAADIVCATPSMAAEDVYREWRTSVARGIAIDEAANMTRADLACVWGNSLLPCFLAGDEKQLPPAVMTGDEQDSEGNLIHRFVADGKLSALEYLMGTGLPVYRLKTQLRMGCGLFDMVAKEIYPEVPFTYDTCCNVNLDKFAVGRDLESYARAKYPNLVPAPSGTLQPIFVHCEGSSVFVDKITGSKYSRDQIKIALDFAVDLLKFRPGITSSNLVLLTPYVSNVALIATMRKSREYAASLINTPPASTIEGFQGQEGDIVLVVMSTNRQSGPGFVYEGARLNLLLTRQRSGLVIFGDLTIAVPAAIVAAGPGAPPTEDNGNDKKGKGKSKGKSKGKGKDDLPIRVYHSDGSVGFTKATVLRNVFRAMSAAGRFVIIKATKLEKA
ncbi:putative ATP-dependent helicase like protein [Verticillium longisporum]|nr:putative ATP-dependent helicase like protein [Verticillium longisporum]